jgi:perosamine synthetase
VIDKIKIIFKAVIYFFKSPYFGFIYGHSYLTKEQLTSIESLIGCDNNDVIHAFEEGFQKIIGGGECISYAAARMGFYDLMKVLDVDCDSEVILTGSTCSVMVNAVLRIGAKPIYSDIDSNTFGSSYGSIKKCITRKTKIIVAQHSFGIPCDIVNIKDLAEENGVFLLEDCALALGSKVNGRSVGNFGGAALFSTDHSKPINTFTGGIVYTKNSQLCKELRYRRDFAKNIPCDKEKVIFRRIKLESRFCNPSFSGRMLAFNLIQSLRNKILGFNTPFLSSDSDSMPVNSSDYPYPAKMPSSLAQLGIYEVERWGESASNRKELCELLFNMLDNSSVSNCLPGAYHDSSLSIVPLRFVWSDSNGYKYKNNIADFIDIDSIWFLKPVVSTNENMESYGYKAGACPISEELGPGMFNIPCNIDRKYWKLLMERIDNSL